MSSTQDDRKIFVWLGRDPIADTNRLADATAEKLVTELFELNGNLFWLDAGKFIPASKNILRELITRHFKSIRPVNRGSADAPVWETEFHSFGFSQTADTSKEPNERVLIDLAAALALRVARGPSEPRILSPQHQQEIRDRLKVGEPRDKLARDYAVDAATIRRLAG